MFAIQVHEDKEAAGAFDERCNGGAVERPTDEVPFPMAGYESAVDLGRALAQERAGETRTPRGDAAAR